MKDKRVDELIDIIMPMFKEVKEHIEQCQEFQSNTHDVLKLLRDAIVLEKELKK